MNAIQRILDANANRAFEGLRVVEEFVRFVLNDVHLCSRLKAARHTLRDCLTQLQVRQNMEFRDTHSDVGATIEGGGEYVRNGLEDVVRANAARVQQSLRVIEEYGKLIDPDAARKAESARYEMYILEKAILTTHHSNERLADARLYVLLDGRGSEEAFVSLATTLIESGVDVIQIRDKTLSDRELVSRAKTLRGLTRDTNTLCIINDRPDIAALADADGVHVGQDEISVHDARSLLEPGKLVGVSTHSLEQAQEAVIAGANYIGIGPVFPSNTKHFHEHIGVSVLTQVAESISLPTFAIGGIDQTNTWDVLNTGVTRIAVSNAIVGASDPKQAARDLIQGLSTVLDAKN